LFITRLFAFILLVFVFFLILRNQHDIDSHTLYYRIGGKRLQGKSGNRESGKAETKRLALRTARRKTARVRHGGNTGLAAKTRGDGVVWDRPLASA
jgi:hypothetical protein